MNNKATLKKVQDGIEQAMTAYDELEAAINSADQRKIGAALYLLRHDLKELQKVLDDIKGA